MDPELAPLLCRIQKEIYFPHESRESVLCFSGDSRLFVLGLKYKSTNNSGRSETWFDFFKVDGQSYNLQSN